MASLSLIAVLAFYFYKCHSMDTLWITVKLENSTRFDSNSYFYNLLDANYNPQHPNIPTETNDAGDTFTQSWGVTPGECYTYNFSVFSIINKLNTVTMKMHDETLGIFSNLNHANFMQYFCISPEIEIDPVYFRTYISFGNSKQAKEERKIYHRHRQVYYNLDGDTEVCNGFKATQMYDEYLSLHLPENDKSCDEIIDFYTEFGYCECFGRKIIIIILNGEHNSCSNICNSINNGCADKPPDAILNPNAIVGCDGVISDGMASAGSLCALDWHICLSDEELDYLHLTSWLCRTIPNYDTFYASGDTAECGNHRTEQSLIMGCGNKATTALPISPSFCDIYSYSLPSVEDTIVSENNTDNNDDVVWYIEDTDNSVYTSIRKKSESNGGVMCCIDNDHDYTVVAWTKWELVLLAIAHAIFVVIFVLTFTVMCERMCRYICVRRCIKRYRKWKQKKRLDVCTKQGTFKKYHECIKEKNCAICLDEYMDNDKVMILNCGHHYHTACGRTWLLEHDSCPLCLQPIRDSRDLRVSAETDDSNHITEEMEMQDIVLQDLDLTSN